ncbi:MAG: hypothetical protein WC558_11185, partial [Patulibacter sp.]
MSATFVSSTSPPVSDHGACATCSAPLGPTARYCLNCGARQAGARTELLDLVPVSRPDGALPGPASVAPTVSSALVTSPAPPEPAALAVPPVPPASVALAPLPPAPGPRTWPFALTAVVLIALVVGLLVGRWLADGRDVAPQVIRIEGASGPAVPSTAAPAPTDAPATGEGPAPVDAPVAGD